MSDAKTKGSVPKRRTARAGKYSYRYADLADTIRVVYEEHPGIDLQQTTLMDERLGECVATRYREPDGEWSEWVGYARLRETPGNNAAQAYGGALTYSRRYSLQMAFCLAADDTDANPVERPASQQQVQRINMMLQRLNVNTPTDAQHLYLAALAGREIKRAGDLTDAQADNVLAYLDSLAAQ